MAGDGAAPIWWVVLGHLPQETRSCAPAGYFFPSSSLFGTLRGSFAASSASTRTASAGALTDLLCTTTCPSPRRQLGIHTQPHSRGSSPARSSGHFIHPAEAKPGRKHLVRAQTRQRLKPPGAFQVSQTHTRRKRDFLLPFATAGAQNAAALILERALQGTAEYLNSSLEGKGTALPRHLTDSNTGIPLTCRSRPCEAHGRSQSPSQRRFRGLRRAGEPAPKEPPCWPSNNL